MMVSRGAHKWKNVALALNASRYNVEIVHMGENKARLAEAEQAGMKSVLALVLDGLPYPINFDANLADLK